MPPPGNRFSRVLSNCRRSRKKKSNELSRSRRSKTFLSRSTKSFGIINSWAASTTNLLFNETRKIFSRGIPIAGNSITVAIAKEFGESLAAAELRKKRDAFVSLGGAYAEPENVDVARASKIVRGAMTRLH